VEHGLRGKGDRICLIVGVEIDGHEVGIEI